MRTLILAAIAAFFIACTPGAMRQATVLVKVDGGHGSGVVVAENRILTARHVVDFAESVTVEYQDGSTKTARVLWKSEVSDLALIEADTTGYMPAVIDCSPVENDEAILVVGNPLRTRWAVTRGHVATDIRDHGMVFIDALISPGNSGGPVFDTYGQLRGIAVALQVAPIGWGREVRGLSLMVPISDFCGLTV